MAGFDLYNWTFTEGKTAGGNGWTIAVPDGFIMIESPDSDEFSGQKRPFELIPVSFKDEDYFADMPVRILPGILTDGQGTKMIHPEARAGVAAIIGVTLCETMEKMMGVAPGLITVGWRDLSASIMVQEISEGACSYQCSVYSENKTQQLRIEARNMNPGQKQALETSIQAWLRTMRFDSPEKYFPEKTIFEESLCYEELLKGNTAELEEAVVQARTEYITSVNGKVRLLEYLSGNGMLDENAAYTIRVILAKGMAVKLFFLEKADGLIDKLQQDNAAASLLKSVMEKLSVLDEDFLELELDGKKIRIKAPREVEEIRAKWKKITAGVENRVLMERWKAVDERIRIDAESEKAKAAEELKAAAEKRIQEIKAKEAAESAEAARNADEEPAEEEPNVKRRIKRISTFVLIDLAFIAVVLAFIKFIIPFYNYHSALALYENGRYEEAMAAFETMDGYKDSAMRMEACETALKDIEQANAYAGAVELMNAGKYDEAISAFEALKGYKDSATQIEACRTAQKDIEKANTYASAEKLMNERKYEEAIALFETIEGYKDSKKQISYCRKAVKDKEYASAVELMKTGNIVEAYEKLIALDGYKDSTKKAEEIFFQYETEKIKAAKKGDIVSFGKYEQDNNTGNGKENIEWLVLAKEDNRVLILSKYALNCQPYNESMTDVTWETCTLRAWLNETFLNDAFSMEEQAQIQTSENTGEVNADNATDTAIAAPEKVFLLSSDEANEYLSGDTILCVPTAYAMARGAWISSDYLSADGEALCWWWLRSQGGSERSAAIVLYNGSIYYDGNYVTDGGDCVRPALWVNTN